jgi:thioredoxin-like negative regulator of GroEL
MALAEAGLDEEARVALEALPAAVYGDPGAVRARAQLRLRELLAARPADDAVRAGLEAVLQGDVARGLDRLLEALREDKAEDSPPRQALVEVLQTIADEGVVRDARRRMAAILF